MMSLPNLCLPFLQAHKQQQQGHMYVSIQVHILPVSIGAAPYVSWPHTCPGTRTDMGLLLSIQGSSFFFFDLAMLQYLDTQVQPFTLYTHTHFHHPSYHFSLIFIIPQTMNMQIACIALVVPAIAAVGDVDTAIW